MRSTSAETVHGAPVRQRMRERCPRPPRQRPAPPESGISARSPCTSGVSDSNTSVGTHATAAGKPVALSPSLPSRAPIPPDWNSVRLKASSPSSSPRQTVIHSESELSASARSSDAWPSAPSTSPGRKCPTRWRAATGAGWVQLRIEPSGAVTRTGANEPALCGTSGAIASFSAYDE